MLNIERVKKGSLKDIVVKVFKSKREKSTGSLNCKSNIIVS